MLARGLLSDTLVLRWPTTTDRDRTVAVWLAELAGVDIQNYGEELLHSSPGLTARGADVILDTDRKSYQMGGQSVSIGQVKITSLEELPDRRAELLEALQERRREGLALICLMVTDVVTGRSHLLCRGENWIVTSLPFTRVADGEFDLGEIRYTTKKQAVGTGPARRSRRAPLARIPIVIAGRDLFYRRITRRSELAFYAHVWYRKGGGRPAFSRWLREPHGSTDYCFSRRNGR